MRRRFWPDRFAENEPQVGCDRTVVGLARSGGTANLGPLAMPPAAIVRRVTLSTKLHPDRFSAMSGKMAAIVAYILGESWTEPEIAALSVTTDGFVLTDAEFFGEAADLDRNPLNLLVAAEVTPEERRLRAPLPRARRRLAARPVRATAGNGKAHPTRLRGATHPGLVSAWGGIWATRQYTKQYT